MAFVKLDCGILNSTLWVAREPRDVFITALLMASPHEVLEPMPQFHVRSLEPTGFVVAPGWYGFIQAAGPGIVRMAMAEQQAGMDALEKLGAPDPESRSSDFEGRRLVRVDGGYIVLNFMKYRDKDMGAADRMKRYRQRMRENEVTPLPRNETGVTRNPRRGVTKAEAEEEKDKYIARSALPGKPVDPQGFAEFWAAWPKTDRKQDRKKCAAKWAKDGFAESSEEIVSHVEASKRTKKWLDGYEPAPLTYLNGERWRDGGAEPVNGSHTQFL